MGTRVLYLSYDGVMEPLGQSQVLAYLRQLADRHQISIVSYEKPHDWRNISRREVLKQELNAIGIRWYPLRYHKRLSSASTMYDVLRGLALSRRLVRRQGIQVVHARSYVSSLIALQLKRQFGVRYLFDMRGFWPDEKVDAGTWSRGSGLYSLAKRAERAFLISADAVVSLTHAGVQAMQEFEYLQGIDVDFTVIPTCVDLERFKPAAALRRGPFTLGYVGNASGWYRFGPVVAAFERIRSEHPNARFVIANRGQHDVIRRHLDSYDVPTNCVELTALAFTDVPDFVRQMDASAFFIEPTLSKQASAPTRLAEFLASGVSCLVNDGVGDTGKTIREAKVGVVIGQISDQAAADGAARLLELARDPVTRARCIETARQHFSLSVGVEAYDLLYCRLRRKSDFHQ